MSDSPQPPQKSQPEPSETRTTSSSKGGGRFALEAEESSTKSSKQTHKTTEDESDSVKRPRKFAVEPIEQIHASSKEHRKEAKTDKPRKFAPQPVQISHASSKETKNAASLDKPRKFAPELVEMSHGTGNEPVNGGKPRRFAPQPVETSHASSKENAPPQKSGKPHARFAPQLMETSERTRKGAKIATADSTMPEGSGKAPARKFAVQLIETAQRSRKAGDPGPAVLHSDRTEATVNGKGAAARRPGGASRSQSSDGLEDSPYNQSNMSEKVAEARRLGIQLPRRNDSSASSRSHSFRIPELDRIDSSGSEGSENGTATPSFTSHESTSSFDDPTRRRESVDVSGYFLQLAARQAERQLQDAALAAFPNDDRHNPVDHFVDKDDEGSYSSDAWSIAGGDGGSNARFVKVNWGLREAQKHAEGKAAAKQKDRAKKEAWRSLQKKHSAASPWGNAAAALYGGQAGAGAREGKDIVDPMKQMRNSARPPMLGGSIRFPRCPSPEAARFDVTQGSETQKRAMCYLSAQHEVAEANANNGRDTDPNGMWTLKKPDENEKPALWQQELCPPSPDKGLWAGFCVEGTGLTPPRGPTGLVTPFVREDNPLEIPQPQQDLHQLPPSPPPSNSGTEGLEEKLRLEQAIDAEFSDVFVTQVYNYLSLGYPSMARKFDHELSKISRIDVAELRQDDVIAGARGYIRFGEENGLDVVEETGVEVKEHHCARWRALRAYVREWARQQPSWRVEVGGQWATAARRGSWAW